MTQSPAEPLELKIERLQDENALLRRQLIDAQRMSSVGALASSITHEFNNILTTVINYAKMGLRHKDGSTRDKSFDKILAASQRASKITTGMLAYARGRGDRREPIDLALLADEVLVLVEKDLQMHRVRVETAYVDHPWAEINAGQVQQVLLNLVINARQAMEAGGTLTLTVSGNPQTGMAEISVRDTGSGIPAEVLPHIFDPFFTTKKADAQGQGGTGLGLAMCRDVIEAHKGRIRVESTLGRGTTFTLRFPQVQPPAFAGAAPGAQPAQSAVTVNRAG